MYTLHILWFHLHKTEIMIDAENMAYLLVLYLSYSIPPIRLPAKYPTDRAEKITAILLSLPDT